MLDIRDLAMMTSSSDEIEVLPDAWVELDEAEEDVTEHAIACSEEETTIDVYDEVEDDGEGRDCDLAELVASLTAELCVRPVHPPITARRR